MKYLKPFIASFLLFVTAYVIGGMTIRSFKTPNIANSSSEKTILEDLKGQEKALRGRERPIRSYKYLDGLGGLTLSKEPHQKYTLSIQTTGPTGHSCTVNLANIGFQSGLARLQPIDYPNCILTIKQQPDFSLVVSSETHGACRVYCGVNASFFGRYRFVGE